MTNNKKRMLCLAMLCLLFAVACAKKQAVAPTVAVTLEVRWAKTEPTTGFTPMTADGPEQKTYYVSSTPILTGIDVASAKVVENFRGPVVSFTLNYQGEDKMRSFTSTHLGEFLAIIVDGRLVSAPIIKSEVGKYGLIDGKFTLEEAQRIAAGLNAGR